MNRNDPAQDEKIVKVHKYEVVKYEGTCPYCNTSFDEEEPHFEAGYIECPWCGKEVTFEVENDG